MAVWELPGKKWELWKEINKAEAVCSLCDSYETDWGVEFQNMWPSIFSSTCQIFNGTLQSRETACSGTLGRMDGMMELNRKMSQNMTVTNLQGVYAEYCSKPYTGTAHAAVYNAQRLKHAQNYARQGASYVLTQDFSIFIWTTKKYAKDLGLSNMNHIQMFRVTLHRCVLSTIPDHWNCTVWGLWSFYVCHSRWISADL